MASECSETHVKPDRENFFSGSVDSKFASNRFESILAKKYFELFSNFDPEMAEKIENALLKNFEPGIFSLEIWVGFKCIFNPV